MVGGQKMKTLESMLISVVMGVLLLLFVGFGVTNMISIFHSQYGSGMNETSIGSLNNMTNETKTISDNMQTALVGNGSGDQSFLTTMKNVITGRVLSFTSVYKIYRSFINNMMINLGVEVPSTIVTIVILATTLFVLLIIALLILRIFT